MIDDNLKEINISEIEQVQESDLDSLENKKNLTPLEILDNYNFSHSIQIDKEEIDDDFELLDQERLNTFLKLAKETTSIANKISDDQILKLFNIRRKNLTKAGALIFSDYPQTYFPQINIRATLYPGLQDKVELNIEDRYLETLDISGSIPEMLEDSIRFIKRNIHCNIIIDKYGTRADRFEYPIEALKEALLNALIHRDYSFLNINRPIKLDIFKDRIEITSPGGLYIPGNSKLEDGIQEIRNPNIVKILSILKLNVNMSSGILKMKQLMKDYNLPEPEFVLTPDEFKVIFYNKYHLEGNSLINSKTSSKVKRSDEDILEFCSIPRTRKELLNFLDNKKNVISKRIIPLVRIGKLRLTNPDHPKSPFQEYVRVN